MSSTYIANIIGILTLVLPAVGIHIANPDTLAGDILTIVGIASTLYIFIGRYRAGGIGAFGFRKG